MKQELKTTPDPNGPYCVVIAREFYVGTLGVPGHPQLATENDGSNDTLAFPTISEAQEWIDEREADAYHLAHGEVGAPEYWIVPASADQWLEAVSADASLIDWDGCDCVDGDGSPCGSCDTCAEWMDARITEYLEGAKVEAPEETHTVTKSRDGAALTGDGETLTGTIEDVIADYRHHHEWTGPVMVDGVEYEA